MAIVQVSRITQRKGLEQDLPQPLAGAEFGWALDQRRLFIGNGTIEDGAPVVGNTEVLTEFSDLLSYSTAYTYKGEAAGYTVQTGATSGDPVSQSLQSRLDSYAITTDFGAVGDGSTDVTAAINRALFQLYCVQNNTQIRRSLFFPAGTYIITDTLLIPPWAQLYGEGSDSTIILFTVQTWAANTAYAVGVLVKDSGSYYRSIAAVPATGILLNNTSYWQPTTLPDLVARTSDSLQQTDVNIGVGGAAPPQHVSISNMAFKTTETGSHNVFLVEKAKTVRCSNVTFAGDLTTLDLQDAVDDLSGLLFSSTTALPCTDIVFDNCTFSGMTYGVNTAQQTAGVVISNGRFDTLYQGALIGGAVVVDGGPTGFKILHNVFDNIYNEGVIIQGCSLNATGYNTFYDVGNHFNGSTLPATPVISIDANNNISVGDLFERNDSQSVTYPRIDLSTTNSIAMGQNTSDIVFYQAQATVTDIGMSLDLGTLKRSAGIVDVLVNNSGGNLVVMAKTAISSFNIDYVITRSNTIRKGTLTVVGGQGSGTTGFSYVDNYVENGSTGVTLTPADSGTVLSVGYTCTSTGVDGSIRYSVSNFGI